MVTVILLTAGGLVGLSRLHTDFSPAGLLDHEIDQRPVLVVVRAADVFAPHVLTYIHQLSELLPGEVVSLTHTPLPHISPEGGEGDLDAILTLLETEGLSLNELANRLGGAPAYGRVVRTAPVTNRTAQRLRDAARSVYGLLVNEDATSTIVGAVGDVDVIEASLPPPPVGVEIALTGLPILEREVETQLSGEAALLLALTVFGNLLVLVFFFRRAPPIAVVMLCVGATVTIVLGGMGWLDLPLTLLTAIVAPLLVTIAIGDAVHLVSRQPRMGPRPRHVTLACFGTSATTAVGFGSLAFAPGAALRDFGLIAAVGVFVALGVVLTVTNVLRPNASSRSMTQLADAIAATAALAGRRRYLLVALSLLVLGAAVILGVPPAGGRLLEPLPEDHPAVVAAADLEQGLGGFRRLSVVTDHAAASDATALERATNWWREQPGVLFAASKTSRWRHLESLMQLTAQPLTAKRADALERLAPGGATIEVGLRDLPAESIVALVEAYRSRDATATVEGEAIEVAAGLLRMRTSLVFGLLIAALVIFMVIAGLLKSWRLGAISILPNIVPLAVALVWMNLRGIALSPATAMVFVVSLGLVVDGTIHVLFSYRYHHDVTQAMRHAGPGLLLAALTLLAGFVALFVSRFPPIRLFAELSSVAIVSGLAAELWLLPALLRRLPAAPRQT